jgi:hypothetical protein
MQWSMTVVLVLAISLFAAFALLLGETNSTAKMTLADILEVYRRKDRMDGDQAVLLQSCDAHRDTLTRLIEGRLSLQEAATTLSEEIERLPPRLRPPCPLAFPSARDEESRMQMTVKWVEILLEDHPYREQIRERLRGELQAYRDAHRRESTVPMPTESGSEMATEQVRCPSTRKASVKERKLASGTCP